MSKLLASIFCLLLLLPTAVGATEALLPSKVQAALLFKILKYDKNTESRSQGTINLIIILDGSATGRKSELASGFSFLNGQAFASATIKVATITPASADTLPAALKTAAGNVIYLPLGVTSTTAAAAISYGKANKIPVFSDDLALSTKGAAVCLVLEGDSPKMVINLPASQAQGMALSADLLKLARVIR